MSQMLKDLEGVDVVIDNILIWEKQDKNMMKAYKLCSRSCKRTFTMFLLEAII